MESLHVAVFLCLSLQENLMCYTCNIGAYNLLVTLPGSIQVLYKLLQLLNQLLRLKVIALGGCSTCSGLFFTKSGICSSLILVGIEDADEHGIPGVNAGHLHLSVWHCAHTSILMF